MYFIFEYFFSDSTRATSWTQPRRNRTRHQGSWPPLHQPGTRCSRHPRQLAQGERTCFWSYENCIKKGYAICIIFQLLPVSNHVLCFQLILNATFVFLSQCTFNVFHSGQCLASRPQALQRRIFPCWSRGLPLLAAVAVK